MQRTFRETESTTENVFRVAADYRRDWLALRGMAEFGNRDFDNYDAAFGEDQSFLEPGSPANQTVLRRYDQAKRDLTRLGAQAEVSPGSGKFSAFASYTHTQYSYDQSPVPCQDVELFPGQEAFCPGGQQTPLGLVDDGYDSFTFEANLAAGERATVYAFYTWEDGDILQTGRQSGSTLNFATNDVFSANITTSGNSFGAGADFAIVPDKWSASLFARFQKVDGNNDVSLLPGFSTAIYGTTAALQDCVGGGPTPARSRRSTTRSTPSCWPRCATRSPPTGPRVRPSATRTTISMTRRRATRSTTCPRRSSCRRTTAITRPGWAASP